MTAWVQTQSKGWFPEGLPSGLPFMLVLAKAGIDGEAVGELGTIISEDGVNRMREMRQEALEEGSGSLAVPAGVDFQVDVSRGSVDSNKGVASASVQGRQILQVNPRLRGDKHG